MCEDIVKKIYDISKEYDVEKIAVVTNHIKITGNLCKCEDKKNKDDKYILTLMNAKMWRLEDVCRCGEPDCNCEGSCFCSLDWLHINVSKIIAFSLMK